MTTTEIKRTRNAKRKTATIDGQWSIAHPTKTALAVQGALIEGAKGSSKPPAQYVPVESPQSLRSKARGRILDLIAHGPIVGLVNGLQSIRLDDTPLQNPDGTFNFEGVTVQTREGYPDQAYIPGFAAVENTVEVNAEVKFATPIVRTVTNNDANAVIVTVAIRGLTEQKQNGDLVGYRLPYAVDVRQAGGAWNEVFADVIEGKTTTAYQRSSRVPLNGQGPFDLRVRRTNTESADAKITDDLYWAMMTEVIDARLNYPDSALVAIDVDAELFGSKMPARYYDVELSIIKVPSNYDPRARTYTGFWDGSFKLAWSDNPAWCYYDLATHPVIGANNQAVDKWALYRIAQYCDGLVPDGYGGMERRFTCNTLFASREEAITTLNTLASVWRGMVYWGAESVMAVGDMPGDAVKLVTPANITSDGFEYVGTSLRERHSVAVVMWNDPNDNYKQVPELYEDPESIQLFGWRETQVTAACCTSRGQARRLAKWILYSERMETEIVSYTASTDHSDLRPGDFIKISDPDRAGVRLSGRVKNATARVITLDKAPAPADVTGVWYLNCLMPSGVIQQREVLNFNGDVCTLKTDFPEVPLKAAVWVLSSAQVVTPMYRVTSVIEQEDGVTYQISATEHNPYKYDFVEFDLQLPPTPDSTIPSGVLSGPDHIRVSTYKYITGGTEHQALNISWPGVDDVRCNGYVLEVRDPDDVQYRTVYNGPGLTVDEKDVVGGEWFFRVKATTATGRTSEWVNLTANIAGLLLPIPPDSVQVFTTTFEVTLQPISLYPNQMYEFWRSAVPLALNMIEANAKRVAIGTSLVDVGLKPDTTYYYYVRGTNVYGVSAFVGAQGKTKNDFNDILNAVRDDIMEGDLYDDITGIIRPIAEAAANEAVAALDGLKGYESDRTYAKDFTVVNGDRIYQAKVAVPINTPPPNATYWLDVGQTVVAANGMIQQVAINTSDISELDGIVTAQAVSSQALRAAYRDDNGQGELEDALKSWTSTAAIAYEEKVRASENEALAQRTSSLDAKVLDNAANITTLEQVVSTNQSAMATKTDQISVTVGQNSTAIGQNSTAIGQNSAAIQQTSTAYANTANKLSTLWSVKTQVTSDGKYVAAGFGIGIEDTGTGLQSTFLVSADRFAVLNSLAGGTPSVPFAVVNGVTYLSSTFILDGTITNAKIGNYISSTNYVYGQQGWMLNKDGSLEINGIVPGQGRLVINSLNVSVYDANNVLRVRLGFLG